MNRLSEVINLKLTPVRMIHPKNEASKKNDFRIYACTTDSMDVELNSYDNLSIKGVMQRLELGIEYQAQIQLDKVDPKYGASYNVLSIYQDIPETMEGQRAFLATMLTEIQLREAYETYPDEDIIKLIVDDTFDYQKVKYFGPVVYKRIRERIMENLVYKDILSRLAKYGINYDVIIKLEEKFGSKDLVIQKIEDCPYILTVLPGWGFKRADKVAKLMGVAHDNEDRVKYGIRFTIDKNQQNGHTFMYREELLRSASEELDLEEAFVDLILDKTEELKFIEDKVSLIRTYNTEKYIAKRLKQMLERQGELPFNPEEFIEYIEDKYKDILPNGLSQQQKDFFGNIQKYPVNLLVGYAGTGKSQLQKFLKELLDKLGLTFTMLSPSAKAAKVTKKYTGVNAQTIHRKIGYGMDKDENNMHEIDEEYVIIDESGMTDVFILASTLSKIKNPKTRILFVGDDFQLLSIQAGNFLHDAIESGVIPMTKLDIVFRQSEGGILDIATNIREGKRFVKDDFTGKQLFGNDFLLHCVDQIHMEAGYQSYYKILLNTYNPEDIMVLTPKKKSNLGTVQINKYIQSIVNDNEFGEKAEHKFNYGEDILRVGDFVLNTTNMYTVPDINNSQVDVVNGDSGIIKEIKMTDEEKQHKDDELMENQKKGIVIDFDDMTVRFDFELANQLLHAWSLTIHKSQGSACEAAICVIDKSCKFQLSANLIYTAITRAKQKCVFLTQAETLNYAIRKVDSMRRNTHLCELLRQQEHSNE